MTDAASLRHALQTLHETYRVPNVVISSIPLKPWLTKLLPPNLRPPADAADADYLACIASSRANSESPAAADSTAVYAKTFPCLPGYFSGVGDLFSALVLAHFHPTTPLSSGAPASGSCPLGPTETPLSRAASLALTKTHALLALTHAAAALAAHDEARVLGVPA